MATCSTETSMIIKERASENPQRIKTMGATSQQNVLDKLCQKRTGILGNILSFML